MSVTLAPSLSRRPRPGTRARSRPWTRELVLFAVAYAAYGIARWVVTGDLTTATDNAKAIVSMQEDLGIAVESAVQTALLGSFWLWLLNHLYLAAQFVVVPGVLIWLYKTAPGRYRRLRDTVLATWLLSVPVFALFPVAPPRLADVGLLDTISGQTGLALDSRLATALYNPLAAVPSLHAGFAFAVSLALIGALRAPWAKVAAATWAPIVGLSVVATGNHYVFDIAAGIAITMLGAVVARGVARQPCPPRTVTAAPATAR